MLTNQEISAIDEKVAAYPYKKAAGPDALKIVQQTRGWITSENLRDVADHLEMSVAELDSVATFCNRLYSAPTGKHIILLCDSVTCWIRGYASLRDHLMGRLGIKEFYETSADGLFTLLPAVCLGACDLAPAMMVDQTLYGNLTNQEIDRILVTFKDS